MNISVVITCYSEGERLLNAIRSVEEQNFNSYELLIVNDNSLHSETNAICKQLEHSGYNIIWRPKNGGLSAARNTGIALAKNEIIVPLDADDILPPDTLSTIHQSFSDNNHDFIFGNYTIKDTIDSRVIIDTSIISNIQSELDPYLLANNWILLGTSPFKKQLWIDLKGYDESNVFTNSVQDIDFFMRAVSLEKKGLYISKIIYQWNKSPSGMNKNVKNTAFCYLDLKNIHFLSKYKFKNKAQMNNYMATMLFNNKLYPELIAWIGKNKRNGLSLKNKLKYFLAFPLKHYNG